MDRCFFKLLEFFKAKTGISFNKHQYPILQNKLTNFMTHYNIDSCEALYKNIQNPPLLQKLINYLTVTESYFFRETKNLNFIVNKVISNPDRVFEILSLPSSSGEEAYTLLIMLLEKGAQNFVIEGMDINSDILEKARKAIYSRRKVIYVPQDILKKYFERRENKFEIKKEFRQKVTFKQKNLFEAPKELSNRYDFILCRNLFIYFDNSVKQKAMQALKELLKPGGYLLLGHADLVKSAPGFKKISPTIFQKI